MRIPATLRHPEGAPLAPPGCARRWAGPTPVLLRGPGAAGRWARHVRDGCPRLLGHLHARICYTYYRKWLFIIVSLFPNEMYGIASGVGNFTNRILTPISSRGWGTKRLSGRKIWFICSVFVAKCLAT